MMKLISEYFLRSIALGFVVMCMSACVTDPPEEPWQDVGAFAWPTELGTTMRYKVASIRFGTDTATSVVMTGKLEHDGRSMYRFNTSTRDVEKAPQLQLHYLPTRDTLFFENTLTYENELKTTYALVAPLDRGATWIATYEGRDTAMKPTIRATVIERYNYWKLEGKGYENVVAVRYELIESDVRTEWIRFYAQGVGVILTIKNVYPASNYPTQAPPDEIDRYTLMDTSPAQ